MTSAIVVCVAATTLLTAQAPAPGAAAAAAVPTPRTSWDAKPNFSGVWGRERHMPAGEYGLPALEKLYRPEIQAIRAKTSESADPSMHCAPYAYPRAMLMTHAIQIVQTPKEIVLLTEYNYSFRVIPIDGRGHRNGIAPSFQGDSVGRWDGDTLVVDVTNFNGNTWLGHAGQRVVPSRPGIWLTSDALHVVERWRLVDGNNLEYEAVVDDPKMLTGTWRPNKIRRHRESWDLVGEAVCVDDSNTVTMIQDLESGKVPR